MSHSCFHTNTKTVVAGLVKKMTEGRRSVCLATGLTVGFLVPYTNSGAAKIKQITHSDASLCSKWWNPDGTQNLTVWICLFLQLNIVCKIQNIFSARKKNPSPLTYNSPKICKPWLKIRSSTGEKSGYWLHVCTDFTLNLLLYFA